MKTTKHRKLSIAAFLILMSTGPLQAGVIEDLELLRDRCLQFAAGSVPNAGALTTIRHDLYAQSPFSPEGEIDLAASAFALAGLPAAVENGVIASNSAYAIASNAAFRVRQMVELSASATNVAQYAKYGYKGMLYHYATWSPADREFHGNAGVEVSSIDTTLLMYGLLASAQYFGGDVRTHYEAARDGIDWQAWLDTSTAHSNQFRMAYQTTTGFEGWWDWRTDETSLICIFAAMSDPTLDAEAIWNAWTRHEVTYVSPAPDARSFTCYATYFGDPFTVFYGSAFLDFARIPSDINGVDWFHQNHTAYRGHVEFFAKERGYLNQMSRAYFGSSNGSIAEPKSSSSDALVDNICVVYSLVGGLPYYGSDPLANDLAQTVSSLVTNNAEFFAWTGWPVATIDATDPSHPMISDFIIGQDIAFIGVAIDNYLTGRIQNLVFTDSDMQRALDRIFPPRCTGLAMTEASTTIWYDGIPFGAYDIQHATSVDDIWLTFTQVQCDTSGVSSCTHTESSANSGFYRIQPVAQ